jgi:tRNA 2-thiouridine synthesizing protein A
MAYEPDDVLDCKGMSCPKPILMTKKAIEKLEVGQILKMLATDPGSKPDMEAWTNRTGNELLAYEQDGDTHIFYIKKTG